MKNFYVVGLAFLSILVIGCADTLYTETFPEGERELNKLPEFWDAMYAFPVEDTTALSIDQLFNNLVAKEVILFERTGSEKGSVTFGRYIIDEIYGNQPPGIFMQVVGDSMQYTLDTISRKVPFKRLHDGYLLSPSDEYIIDLNSNTAQEGDKPSGPIIVKKRKDQYFFNLKKKDYWILYVIEDNKDGSIKIFTNTTESIKDNLQRYTAQFPARLEDQDVVVYPNSNQVIALLDDPDFFVNHTLLSVERKPIEKAKNEPSSSNTGISEPFSETNQGQTTFSNKSLLIIGGLLGVIILLLIITLIVVLFKRR